MKLRKLIPKPLLKALAALLPTRHTNHFDQRTARRTIHDITVDDVIQAIDAAEQGDMGPMIGLGGQMFANDGHARTEFAKRKLAVMGDPFDVVAYDKAVPADVEAAGFIKAWIEDCDDWPEAVKALLEATVYPAAVLEKVFAPAAGGERLKLASLRRVNPELFDYSTGGLMLKETTDGGLITGGLKDLDPAQYVVHRGDPLCVPDQMGGLIRPLFFWHLVKYKDWEWWSQFLERFGAPFMIGRYDAEDDDSRYVLEDAMGRAARLFGVVVSKDTEFDLVQANASQNGEAYERLHRTANEEISKIILGQFGTTQGGAAGLNGNTTAVLDGVRQDFKFFDATQLAETVRRQIFRQILAVNGKPGRAPRAVWGDNSAAENAAFVKRLVKYRAAGLRLDAASIRQISARESVTFIWEEGSGEAVRQLSARVPLLSPQKTAEIANARVVSAAAPRIARGFAGDGSFELIGVPDDDPFLSAMLAVTTQP